MELQSKRDIKELLTKENERCRLIQLGFFTDIDAEVDFILKQISVDEGESFEQWKSRVMKEYFRMKGFSIFCRNNIDNVYFERLIKSLLVENLYKFLRREGRTETDKYLAPDNDSISYSLADEMFDQIYCSRFSNISSFGNPTDLNVFCKEIVAELFPLSEQFIIGELKKNINYYWGKVFTKLNSIVAGLSYQMSGITGQNNTHDIWSDTCFTLNAAVVGDKLQKPVNAKSIISYAVGIIKNKNREILRLKKRPSVDIELINYSLTQDSDDNFFNTESSLPENFKSQDYNICNYIDTRDEESLRNYLIVVLYNKEHPLHNRLVNGYEESLKMFFEHYLDNVSYEDLVVKYYGQMSDKELIREAARIRQEFKRLKDKLIIRFDKLIKGQYNG